MGCGGDRPAPAVLMGKTGSRLNVTADESRGLRGGIPGQGGTVVAQMLMPTLVVMDYAEATFDLVALLAVGSLAACGGHGRGESRFGPCLLGSRP